ncbi:histone-lysine N-methyltransferase 2A isoform X2 [Paramormyrops kingsleyae]|uniref:histone-lysine N-methyltransferase 2A isoform X2 n=1 Tax=Paramormyrops kingsleyae TaxID=1676925 RepID=UPI003B970228
MMAAAGCGSATASAVGGPSGMAAARGRFPGRPWSSRSRLRSERRSQLGRLRIDTGETDTGGPRPASSGLVASDDPSHLRLLGIEAKHKRLGEAGYSSSGSEEGDDFPGFEVKKAGYRTTLRFGQRSCKSKPVQIQLSKQIQDKPPPVLVAAETNAKPPASAKVSKVNQACRPRTENTKSQRSGCKNSLYNSPSKIIKKGLKSQNTSKPKITVKLVTKRTAKKEVVVRKKAVKKLKVAGFKFLSKTRQIQGAQLSSAHVKLKSGRETYESEKPEEPSDTGQSLKIARQGRRLLGKRMESNDGEPGAKCEIDNQKMEDTNTLPRLGLLLENRSSESIPDRKRSRGNAAVSKVRSEVCRVGKVPPKKQASLLEDDGDLIVTSENNQEESVTRELSEVSNPGADKPVGTESNGGVGSEEQRDVFKASDIKLSLATELETPSTEPGENLLYEKQGEDMRVPGLKLTRVRNPKAMVGDSGRSRGGRGSKGSSRKKQSKFVWTLTVVKGKSKDTKMEESVDFGKTVGVTKVMPEGIQAASTDSWVTQSQYKEDNQDAKVDTASVTQPEERQEKSFDSETPSALLEVEKVEVVQAHLEEGTQIDDIVISQKAVPPLQLKLVSSPGKQNMQPSLFIRRINPDPPEKVFTAGNITEIPQEPLTLEVIAPPISKRKTRLPLASSRKKRGHKPWTTHKRKSKQNNGAEIQSVLPAAQNEVQTEELMLAAIVEPKSVPNEMGIKNTECSSSSRKDSEPTNAFESSSSEPQTMPDSQAESKGELEKKPTDGEVLVLDPPISERSHSRYIRHPLKRGKKRRRSLIGPRLKRGGLPKLPKEEEVALDNNCPPVATSTPSRPKLVGVLKKKYRRKPVPTSSLPFHGVKRPRTKSTILSKKVELGLTTQLFSSEETVGVQAEPHLASRNIKQGKSKFLKNIRHFIMPVVSARSSRVIKTPMRFMDDAGMSVLPRRASPKKGHHFNLHHRSYKKKDGPVEDHQFPENSVQGDDLPTGRLSDVDLSVTPEPDQNLTLATESHLSESLSGKRKSLLREPSFKWRVLGSSGGEVYTLAKHNEQVSKGEKSSDFLSSVSSSSALKKTQKLNKKTPHFEVYKKLKKLNTGTRKKRRKRISDLVKPALKSSSEAVNRMQDTMAKSSRPCSLLSNLEKGKLKIEDLDSPGVVRKVSVCVRTLTSEMLKSHIERSAANEKNKSDRTTDPVEEESKTERALDSTGPMDVPKVSSTGESIDPEGQKQDSKEELDHSAESDRVVLEEKGTSHRIRLTGANKRMFHLLKRAKVQLIKIDQQKQLKSSQLLSGSQNMGSRDPSMVVVKRRRRKLKERLERGPQNGIPQRVGGPRIKHVCRDAAVVLGQPRAMVPDDVPRLSALPLHERETIPSSPAAQGVSPSEPESPTLQDQKTLKGRKSCGGRFRGDFGGFGLRSRRCGKCKGCLHEEDCGKCMNCLDKPKFGGPNTKRQCCVYKRCDWIEEKKALRLGGKLYKGHGKRRRSSASVCHSSNEEGDAGDGGRVSPTGLPDGQSPSLRKQPRRCVKQRSYCDLLDYDSDLDLMGSTNSASPRRRSTGPRSQDFGSMDGLPGDTSEDGMRGRRSGQHRGPLGRRKVEKSPLEQTPPSVLAALANGFAQREKEPSQPSHKIRVDFKEDCNLQNVWKLGGLSILTSVPVVPPHVCLLCASKGQHEMVYCQVCCEPFHPFCLEPWERPLEENKENWCCRRCRFCHVCGHKGKHSKPLLECERCQNCYHPPCLGPNYPKPNKKSCKKSWVCMTCIRCKSCGVTPGKSWDTEWNHDKGLCPDCTKLYDQGNYCPICNKCYEDNDYDSQMMQCASCNHWVHAKCEELSDDLYEILSSLPESVVYSCQPCSHSQPSNWRELLHMELKAGVEKVLACLLTSSLTQHLVSCSECTALTDLECWREEHPACDLRAIGRKFDKGLYTTLKLFHEDVALVIQKKLAEEAEALPEEQRPSALARSYYLKLLEEVFSWFNGQDSKVWNPCSKEFPVGMLSNAVLPPSTEHVYAQWREREEQKAMVLSCTQNVDDGDLEDNTEERTHFSTPVTSKPVTSYFRNMRNHRLKLKGKKGRPSKADLDTGWSKEDERQCSLCQKYGDAKSNEAGRLLYLGQNEWAHVNCSMWSAEVFEEDNGSLMHVHSAVARGRLMRCERCNQTGATVGCCLTSCQSNYHFMCARTRNCVFQDDKKVFCYKHRDLISGKIITGQGFEVHRRVYVDFEGISLRRKFLTGLEPELINILIGSLQIEKLGVLTELSACQGKLFPVGYQCSRWFWSTVDPRRRCRYTCRIKEVRPPIQEKLVEETPDQGENHTIAHSPCSQTETKSMDPQKFPNHSPKEEPSFPPPLTKADPGARPKVPGYPQTRKPAGGMSRPLPSPGATLSKSHHILTISDLDETCRPRRHSPSSNATGTRNRISSPPLGTSSGAIALREAGSLHPKNSPTTSPDFSVGATENQLPCPSTRLGGRSTPLAHGARMVAPHSTSGLFPQTQWQDSVSSPALNMPGSSFSSQTVQRLSCDLKRTDSTERPHDFTVSSEPQNIVSANILPGKGTSLVSNQSFSYSPFDADSDVGVTTDLEFEETLLNEGVAMNCGAQIVVCGDGEENLDEFRDGEVDIGKGTTHGRASTQSSLPPREDWGNTSSDDDMENYYNFSRTVVTHTVHKEVSQAPTPSSSGTISQLDGVDDGSESDASMVTSDGTQNLKSSTQTQIQNPNQLLHSLHQEDRQTNGLCNLTVASTYPGCGTLAKASTSSSSEVPYGYTRCGSPKAEDSSKQESAITEHTLLHYTAADSLAPHKAFMQTNEVRKCPAIDLPSGLQQSISIVPAKNYDNMTGAELSKSLQVQRESDSELSLVQERRDLPLPDICMTDLVTVQDSVDTDSKKDRQGVFLDPSSGHFVSAEDGSAIDLNPVTEGIDKTGSLEGTDDGSHSTMIRPFQCTPVLQRAVLDSSQASPGPLRHPISMQLPMPTFRPAPLAHIRATVDPLHSTRMTVLPSVENFRTSLSPTEPCRPVPVTVTYVSSGFPSQNETVVSLTPSSGLPLGSYNSLPVPMYPAHTLPTGGTAVSSHTITKTEGLSFQLRDAPQCQPVRPTSHPAPISTPTPILINGCNSTPLQKDAFAGRTISINFSTPRPALEPQQQVVNQSLPGHAILTVREVGGPNVDSTPHVLLVNRLGQIFVKNPENNTFQLPNPSSPSFASVNQIASLLQSNALSATLAAAGNVSGVAGPTVQTQAPKMVTPVTSLSVMHPGASVHPVGHSGNGMVAAPEAFLGRKSKVTIDNTAPGMKKSKSRKATPNPKRNKLNMAAVPSPELSTIQDKPSLNAQAIINKAMASCYSPSGASILSPSHLRTLNRVPAPNSVVLPPDLLIEPEPAATPVSTSSRPRSQVRIKRVSSLSDRITAKKSKVDITELEPSTTLEEQRKTNSTVARSGGVRIKTPTVKGVLDLDDLKEERQGSFENPRPGPWDRLSSASKGGDVSYSKPLMWDSAGRYALTDWNKHSGVISSSDDEMPPPELDDECPVNKDQPHLRFEITSEDGFSVEADSIEVAWKAVIDGVQEARAGARLRQLSFIGMGGARMLGVLHDAVVFLVEQLQGAKRCQRHTFRFHKQDTQEEELPVNPTGCARSEVYLRKSTFDMFNFLASQHRQLPDNGPYDDDEEEVPLKSTRRATSMELPMAMRFRHLERTSKEAVGVYRSAIHGRGLFCKRNIDCGEMVIEYSGIVIRSVLTDKREKYYDGKGIGCYMFRIDDFDVVDATMHGNAARFINHSCEPNCYSRVINVEGQKHIVIFALRKIYRGEELTYDYKFPIEDASNKLNCNCGARRCRRFLN